jgi:hypothetical protein
MVKKSYLTSAEMYLLTKFVESAKKPFSDWKQAIREMSAKMNRDVSRANIETAANNCGVDINNLVEMDRTTHPFANMMAQVHELRNRVQELEKLVGIS